MNNNIKIVISIGIGTFLFPKQCYSQSNINWKVPFVKVNHNAPNILFICTDQQSWNTIGALGNEYVHTPNLNRLVKEGISFQKTYCQSPVSSPSRASFLTGLYPSTIGVTKNGNQEWTERFPVISKTLKDAGYECGLIGKYHLSTAQANRPEKRPEDDGYSYYKYSHSPYQGGSTNDYIRELRDKGIDILELKKKFGYVPEEYHQTKWIADKAISFIKEKREWPWLLNINIYDPHGPFDAPSKYVNRYDTILDKIPLPPFKDSDLKEKGETFKSISFQSFPKKEKQQALKKLQAAYWAQIDFIDEQIGRILSVLEETNQLDKTLIIFTSDHGDMTGDHGYKAKGCRFYEALVRVPLIFWHPSQVKQNVQSQALVELIDIVPTILDMVGLPKDCRLEGKSLYPIILKDSDVDIHTHKKHVRCEYFNQYEGKLAAGTMIRTEQYKLVTYHGFEKGELFDLVKDPEEFNNLWDEDAYKEVRFKLTKQSFDALASSVDRLHIPVARY